MQPLADTGSGRLRPGFSALVLAVLVMLVGGAVALGALVVVLAGGGGRPHRRSSDYALDLPTAPTDPTGSTGSTGSDDESDSRGHERRGPIYGAARAKRWTPGVTRS